MVESPYNKGDTVSLNQEYEILKLISETERYWLYEALQTDILKKVKVIVYNDESFTSSIEVEIEWKSDAEIIQKQSEFLEEKVDFVESGVKMDGGKLQYIIVFSSVDVDVEAKPTTGPTTIPSSGLPTGTAPIIAEKPQGMKVAKEKVAAPQRTFLTTIDDLEAAAPDRPIPEKAKEKTVEEALAESEPEGMDIAPADEEIVEEIKEMLEEDEEAVEIEEIKDVPAHPNEKEHAPPSPPPTTAGKGLGSVRRKQKKESTFKESVPEKIEEIATEATIEPISDEKPAELAKERSVIVEEDEEKDYVKFIVMDYFDRMNPSNYYLLKIKISDIKKAASAKMVNPITGERKVSERDELEATLSDPMVIVRPSVLGCSVMPGQIETNFDDEEDELTFYVTPGVKGKVIGSIDFINEDEIIHSTKFESKVVDPNYARVVAFYGILTSFAPKILGLLGLNLGLEQTFDTLWGVSSSVFGSMTLAGLIALAGIVPVVILSLVVRWKLKPSEGKLKFNLTNFRLKDFKVKKTKA
ncbi:MAG: hypothetical protein ACTSVH_04135 [Candidatus Heimdallarchaeota archaeon]